jgi:Rieske Fe-S protein
MSPKMTVPRRVALRVLTAAPLAACAGKSEAPSSTGVDGGVSDGGGADASGDGPACPGRYEGGVDDFLGGTFVIVGVGADRAIVTRDDDGLYAFSAICTHADCAIELVDALGHSRCPCHGAEFDPLGAVTRGPATVALPHYRVTICDRKVYVDRSEIVPMLTRAVP